MDIERKKLQVLLFDKIDESIELASTCGGCVFGGYVRDVIVPRITSNDVSDTCNVSNFDLWFRNDERLEKFLAKSANNIKLVENVETALDDEFSFYKYHLLCNKIPIINVNIYVSDFLPVNDFDIHYLTYTRFEGAYKPLSCSDDSTDMLIRNIIKNEIQLLDRFVVDSPVNIARIKKFLDLGYKIFYHDHLVNESFQYHDFLSIYCEQVFVSFGEDFNQSDSNICFVDNYEELEKFNKNKYLLSLGKENENYLFLYDDGIINFNLSVVVRKKPERKILNADFINSFVRDLNEIINYVECYCNNIKI